MPRPKGPEREKAILLRLTEQEHRLANALSIACGTTVQSMLLDLLHQGAKALRVSVPEHVPANQLALVFSRKRRSLRGPSGGMVTRGMGSGKKTRRKPAKSRKPTKRKPPAKAAA